MNQIHDRAETECSCHSIHDGPVAQARGSELSVSRLLGLTELFKVFGDASRLRLLNALADSELCVCDLASALDMSQSAVSHQLAILRGARLVRTRRDGKTVYYALDDEHVLDILRVAGTHLDERKD